MIRYVPLPLMLSIKINLLTSSSVPSLITLPEAACSLIGISPSDIYPIVPFSNAYNMSVVGPTNFFVASNFSYKVSASVNSNSPEF